MRYLKNYVAEVAAHKPKAPPKPRPRNLLLDALARLCYGNADAAFKMRRVPAALNSALTDIKAVEPDVTPERIAACGVWWEKNDFRGQKGQRPEPHQVPAVWLKFMNGDTPNGNRNGNHNTAERTADSNWGPKSGLPVMPGDRNKNGSPAPQVAPVPKGTVPGSGGDHHPA